MHLTLEILISTIDQGIEKIKEVILPERHDVKYIISHQYRDIRFKTIPNELVRGDIIISQSKGQGLTKSRNNAINLATGDICIIADDDVRYTYKYFDTIINTFENNEVDVACLKIFTGNNQPEYKNYPVTEKEITSLVDYSPSSIEITFKLDKVKHEEIFFDERFGMGSWLNGGGENLFIYDAIKKGLKVKFFPFYIVQHPYESTIKSFGKYAQRRVRVGGALDARLNGKIAVIKAFAVTLKILPDLIRHRKNLFVYLDERLSGTFYILNSKK